MKRKSCRTVLEFGLAIVAVVLSATLWSSQAEAQEKPGVVKLGYAPIARPWLLGKIDGAYEKAFGTKVEWISYASGGDALTLLAASELDIAQFGSAGIVTGIIRKLPIIQVAVPEIISTSERLIARKDISNIKGLEGRTVGYVPGTTMHYALLAAFKTFSVDTEKVRLVALKPTEMLAAWKRSDIDAAYLPGPFTFQLEADGGHSILASKDLQPYGYFVWNGVVVRREFAQRYPEIVAKYLAVLQEKEALYKASEAELSLELAKYFSQDPIITRNSLAGLTYPTLEEQLKTTLMGSGGEETVKSRIAAAMSKTAEFLVDVGQLRKQEVPDTFATSIDPSFMKRALAGK